jgi:hypothetical protein
MAAIRESTAAEATRPGIDPPGDDRDDDGQRDGQLRGQLAMSLTPDVPLWVSEP